MGTNYYLRAGICACCGRYDEIHVCKSFSTWNAPYRYEDEAPWGPVVEIATWEGWKSRLRTEAENGGRIFDEYGDEMPIHKFIERAEKHGADAERRQYQAVREAGYTVDKIEPGSTWVDGDGFTFYAGEFS